MRYLQGTNVSIHKKFHLQKRKCSKCLIFQQCDYSFPGKTGVNRIDFKIKIISPICLKSALRKGFHVSKVKANNRRFYGFTFFPFVVLIFFWEIINYFLTIDLFFYHLALNSNEDDLSDKFFVALQEYQWRKPIQTRILLLNWCGDYIFHLCVDRGFTKI